MVGQPFQRQLTDQNLNSKTKTNHFNSKKTYQRTESFSNRQANASCYNFFPTSQINMKFFASRTLAHLGLPNHTGRLLANPKEPILPMLYEWKVDF